MSNTRISRILSLSKMTDGGHLSSHMIAHMIKRFTYASARQDNRSKNRHSQDSLQLTGFTPYLCHHR